MAQKCCFNIFNCVCLYFLAHNFFIVTKKEKREEREKVKHKKIPKTINSEHILKKSAHPLFGVWSHPLIHVQPGPNMLKNANLKKPNHRNVTMKCDHVKMPSDMRQLHVP